MKKTFSIAFASFVILLLFSGVAYAAICETTHPDLAGSLVPCGQFPDCRCELSDLFVMISRIYSFAVYIIALPLAGLFIVIGGTLLLVSGGNPGLAEKGKNILKYTAIGIILVFGSWLIIDVVLKAIGYDLPWNTF